MKIAALVTMLAAAAAAAQEDPLKTARDLYSSAAYDEALAELTRVGDSAAATPAIALEADAYRAFCLLALGRSGEAEAVAESVVRKDPMLTAARFRDASPRITEMFDGVRKRIIPRLIRDEYRNARALVADQPAEAEAHLTQVRQLLAEAKKIGAWDDTLEDLRMLVDGFLDLSRDAEASPKAAPAAPTAAPPAAPSPSPPAPSPVAPPLTPPPAPSAPPTAAAADVPTTFGAGDPGVVAPVVVSQAAPQIPPELVDLARRLRRTGSIDVIIDERGSVEEVIVKQSVSAGYDARVVAAARTWKYRPATKNGVPVRFVKTVVINAQ